jgi:tetratricopeptide (TPR) repeat protein
MPWGPDTGSILSKEEQVQRTLTSLAVWVGSCGLISIIAGCTTKKSDTDSASVRSASTTVSGGNVEKTSKVPITSASDEARTLYTRGRAFAEQIRPHEGRELFAQAAAKDPSFALAHYQLALTAPSAKEFFQHLNEAVALSGKASEGERLMIRSLQAGANADPTQSLKYAEQLVTKYPQDERAHLILGNAYFGQQQYDKAIEEMKKAIEINPEYSPAYNSLGYAYRPVGNYAEAEKAFKKYIDLVPSDPNPYDSYAELLMKTGQFDQSIEQYRKALSIDPHFGSSFVGIAADLMFEGKHDQAIAEAQKLYDAARDDGERRTALFSQTVTYVDAGKTAMGLRSMERQYALAAKIADTAAMSGDAVSMGDILLDAGRPDEARRRYAQALGLVSGSSLSAEVKEDAKLGDHYAMARVALKKNDLGTARSEAAEYLRGAEARHNEFRIRQAHALNGMVALQEKNSEQAIAELAQANQQDPYVLYMTALAFQRSGDVGKAKELSEQAANMNTLPTLDYAFIRMKAKKMG